MSFGDGNAAGSLETTPQFTRGCGIRRLNCSSQSSKLRHQMERQTNLLHLMEQKKWYGDGGYVMSHCCMQCVSQTNYDWIPGTYAG